MVKCEVHRTVFYGWPVLWFLSVPELESNLQDTWVLKYQKKYAFPLKNSCNIILKVGYKYRKIFEVNSNGRNDGNITTYSFNTNVRNQ